MSEAGFTLDPRLQADTRHIAMLPLCELRLGGCTGFAAHVHHHDHNTKNNQPENLFSACVS